jgi:hypothetical protein
MPPLPGDNEKKAFRGKRLQIPAATWNKVIDAAKAHTRQKGREGQGGEDTDTLVPGNTVLVSNPLSQDFPAAYSVIGLGDPILTAEASPVNLSDRLAFTGIYPKADAPFGIFQEPVGEDEIGKAVVAGVSICYVLMTNADDEWASAIDDTPTHLASSAVGGFARILWHDAGGDPPVEGAELAIVLLGVGGSSREYRIHCDDETNLLVWQYSDDGGATWVTDETVDTGIACSSTSPSPSGCDPSGWGWVAGLLYLDDPDADPPVHFSDCLKLTVLSAAGFCAGISTGQVLHLRTTDGITWRSQEWDCDPAPGEWIDEAFVCDPDTVKGAAVFSVDDTTGFPTLMVCGVSHKLTLTCGGNGVVVFTGGGTDYCDGAVPSAACQDNTFVVQLTCECCSIDGWQGPGWYCVLETGDDCDDPDKTVTVLELLDADRCNTAIVICSCKYASEGLANAACGAVITPCIEALCPDGLPNRLYMHFAGGTGAGACLNGQSIPLDYYPSTSWGTDDWEYAFITPDNTNVGAPVCVLRNIVGCGGRLQNTFQLQCGVGNWFVAFTDPDPTCMGDVFDFLGAGLVGATSFTCSPFSATFAVNWGGGNTSTVTVNTTP